MKINENKWKSMKINQYKWTEESVNQWMDQQIINTKGILFMCG